MGLESKFAHKGNLQTFEKKIKKHLIQYGLDMVTYLVEILVCLLPWSLLLLLFISRKFRDSLEDLRTPVIYLATALALDAVFLYYAIQMRRHPDNIELPMRTFKYSITYLGILFAALLVDHYLLVQLSFKGKVLGVNGT